MLSFAVIPDNFKVGSNSSQQRGALLEKFQSSGRQNISRIRSLLTPPKEVNMKTLWCLPGLSEQPLRYDV